MEFNSHDTCPLFGVLFFLLRITEATLIDIPYYITNTDITTAQIPYFIYFSFNLHKITLWYVKLYNSIKPFYKLPI